DFVTNGQKLAALVPVNQLYIDANYKETQLADIYGGEAAYITGDGYDGGRVTGEGLSLAPATGAGFSILPPQNATGNFTKVVQRVPVRIAIPANILAGGRVRAGMSVIVKIDSRPRPKHALPVKAANIAAGPAGTAKQAD
ncbi:MAG: HlyD family secretion protein, partial [Candidatus Tokpelaia sp.]